MHSYIQDLKLRTKIRLLQLRKKNIAIEEMNYDIDFVVTWVDPSDPKWREEYNRYANIDSKGSVEARYRNWDQFRYWFRSVEKYAPWVRKIYLLTYGHIPSWLNTDDEKIVVVQHQDFIPKRFLPTFNSISIEFNMHRIPGLSERFVYFNDDVFLASETEPGDFFINGLPNYCAIAYPLKNYIYNGPFAHQLFSNLGVINSKFRIQSVMEKSPELWFSKLYGKDVEYNYNAYKESYLPGMFFSHLACPFLKSYFLKVWSEIPDILEETCQHRIRTYSDIMHQIIALWTVMEGSFNPVRKNHYGRHFGMLSKQIKAVDNAFLSKTNKCICLNDSVDITDDNYDAVKNEIDRILEREFPQKSIFEKE